MTEKQPEVQISQVEPRNRLRRQLPRVGIRPTIDGRRQGVRESLEDQTMGLARAVQALIETELTHPCGRPVECVVSAATIGGVAEAAACAEQFRDAGVGVSITVTPCWCYGSETMDLTPAIPKAVWGFNGTERPGAVYLAAVAAAHDQKGVPVFKIYGRDVQDADDSTIPADVRQKLLQFTRAGLAVARMRGQSYLSIGNVSMGIGGSIVNPAFFQEYLGMRAEAVDMSEIARRLEEEIYDPDEFETALAWVRAHCKEGRDDNPPAARKTPAQKQREWETVVKMAMIARDLMVGNPRLADLGFGEEALGHNAIVAGFQGQRQWTDHFPNGDFMEAVLNSSFDWTGLRQPYLLATENDALNGVAMLFGHLLTGTAQIFADVRTYWSPAAIERVTGQAPPAAAKDGLIHLINSGSACLDGTGQQGRDGVPALKPFWEITPAEAEACLAATEWRPAIGEYFRGGGFSSCFLTRGEIPMTMSRVNLVKGLGPTLQIAEGRTVQLPPALHEVLDERTNPTWPTTWFVPRVDPTRPGPFHDVYAVMNAWGANHAAVCHGHIGAALITLAAMLRIPVALHNVPPDQVYRPSAWDHFGALDPQGADYRACRALGPLYP